MKSNLEFIINAIVAVSKLNRSEGFSDGKVIIEGFKKGIFSNDEIKIIIQRSNNDPDKAAFVKAHVNGKSASEDILKQIIYDILRRTEMLDNKLKMKLDMLFNDGEYGPFRFEGGELKLKGSLAEFVVSGYLAHLNSSFPTIKDRITIEVIKDTNGKEIGITQDLGWDNSEWLSFFKNGIVLKKALDNCKTCGVEKIVIICNDEYADFTIDDLREYSE